MEILNSNMFRVGVRMRWWEWKSVGEAESEVEDEGADLGEGVDCTEGGKKSVQNSESRGSEWWDMEEHEGNNLCLYLAPTKTVS